MNFAASWSRRVFIWQAVIVVITFLAYKKFYPRRETLRSDGLSYYIYLPAAFIYHDLSMQYVDTLHGLAREKSWVSTYPGKTFKISKMSAGIAVMLAPFFLIAHSLAHMLGIPADGYTWPYQQGVAVAAIFYFLAGLWLLRKTLLYFFSDNLTAVILLIPFFMTNLLNYLVWEPSMSHVYSFFLVSVLVFATVRWHESFRRGHFLLLCLSLGMITLVRPTNVLVAFFPILYGINDGFLWKQKWQSLFLKPFTLIGGALLFLVPVFLQMSIWKYQTGDWYFYSYGDEKFYFDRPHMGAVLFSFRSGWFIYTPVMLLLLPGLYFLFRRKYPFAWGILLFFIANLYVASCWWCYWYGGTMGMRPFIDFYALFLLPVAACLKEWTTKKVPAIITGVVLVFLTWLSVIQDYQFQQGILHYSYMSFNAWKASFGKLKAPPYYDLRLDPDDVEMARQGKPMRHALSAWDFGIKELGVNRVNLKAYNGKYACAEGDALRLISNRDNAYKWESIRIVVLADSTCLLRAWNDQYIFADSANLLRMKKYGVPDCARFRLEAVGNKFAFRACNGKYVGTDSIDFVMRPVETSRNERTLYTIERNDYEYE